MSRAILKIIWEAECDCGRTIRPTGECKQSEDTREAWGRCIECGHINLCSRIHSETL